MRIGWWVLAFTALTGCSDDQEGALGGGASAGGESGDAGSSAAGGAAKGGGAGGLGAGGLSAGGLGNGGLGAGGDEQAGGGQGGAPVGGSAGTPAGGGPNVTPAPDALATYIAGLCSVFVRCVDEPLYPDIETCSEVQSCYGNPLADGISATDQELTACGEALAAFDCVSALQTPNACAFLGAGAAMGESCETASCGSGLDCIFPSEPDACAVCGPSAREGESCANVGCAGSDLYCDDTDNCALKLPLGAPCSDDGFTTACVSTFCEGGQCSRRHTVGESCAADSESCARGLRCVNGTCQEFAHAGDPCTKGSGDCDWLSTCLDGVCTTVCDGGQLVPGFCMLSDDQCAPNEYCDWSTSQCAPRKPLGAPCPIVNSGCDTGLYCHLDECVPMLAVGQPCSTDRACESGYCDEAVGECIATCRMP